jgi:hypothetical protein
VGYYLTILGKSCEGKRGGKGEDEGKKKGRWKVEGEWEGKGEGISFIQS